METIIGALISAAAAIAVCVINGNKQQSKTAALFEYKIGELSNRVEKHNKVIERVYRLEQQEAVTEEKLEVANHRIHDLEQYHK